MQAALKKEIGYDLSRFDNRRVVREQVAKEMAQSKKAVKTVARARVKPCISAFAVFSYVLCMLLLIMTLFSYVKLTEVSDRSIKLKKQLADMEEETQMLEIKKNQKFGSEQIKQKAVEQYGMRKMDKSQVTYVSTEQADKVEILNSNQLMVGDSKLFAGIVRGFHTFLEYIG